LTQFISQKKIICKLEDRSLDIRQTEKKNKNQTNNNRDKKSKRKTKTKKSE